MIIEIYKEDNQDNREYTGWVKSITVFDHEQRTDTIYISNNWNWNIKQIIAIQKDKIPELIEWLKALYVK